MAQRLWVELLGPVRVWADGGSQALGAPRLQGVLGVLATRRDRAVSRGELIDALWGEHPPGSAENAVHVYIRRLRQVLEPDRGHRAPGQLLISVGSGYLLRLATTQLDVEVFAGHRDRANQLRASGDLHGAARSFDAALALVRGTPWSGVPGPFAEVERARLAELRLTVVEERAETLLALGRHVELAAELPGLVHAHPLRERLRCLLMRALYAGDRQAEALEVFRDTRELLITELGIEPGAELRLLQQRILSSDPALDRAEPFTRVPRQLPAPPRPFTGRVREQIALTRLLEEPDLVVISAIGGTAGIGKTWLALHWAHQNVDRFPDGQLHVNLRGFDPSDEPLPVAVAVRGFLDALGVDPATIPVDVDAQAALYRSLVAGKRMLIVLDNARDGSQVVPLLPGSPSCTVLVTSRKRLGGLVTTCGAIPLDLDLFSASEARELLTVHLGRDRVATEPAAVAELLDRCSGLPLALAIMAARAASCGFPLSVLAEELRDAPGRLDALDPGDMNVNLRAVFSSSYRALDADAAEVFGLIGSAPGPDIGLPAAASLAGLPAGRMRALLRSLESVHLLQQHTPGRYRMHDLVRSYAAEQARADSAPLRRLVDFYLHTAYAGDRLLAPHRSAVALGIPDDGCVPVPLAGEAEALAWFDTEHANLVAVLRLATDRGWDRDVWGLAWALDTFQLRRGHLREHLTTWLTGLRSARRLGDPGAEAVAHRLLAQACTRASRHAEAVDHLKRALALAELSGDTRGQAHTHHTLARAWEQQGDDGQALVHATHALYGYQTLANPAWEAMALNTLGWYYARAGRHADARACCERALSLNRQHGCRDGEAATLDSLGYIAQSAGQHAEALTCYRAALDLLRELGETYQEADTLFRLGETHAALGDPDEARQDWLAAVEIYRAQQRTSEVERISERLQHIAHQGSSPATSLAGQHGQRQAAK